MRLNSNLYIKINQFQLINCRRRFIKFILPLNYIYSLSRIGYNTESGEISLLGISNYKRFLRKVKKQKYKLHSAEM